MNRVPSARISPVLPRGIRTITSAPTSGRNVVIVMAELCQVIEPHFPWSRDTRRRWPARSRRRTGPRVALHVAGLDVAQDAAGRVRPSPTPFTAPSITRRSKHHERRRPATECPPPFTTPSRTFWLNQYTAADDRSRTGTRCPSCRSRPGSTCARAASTPDAEHRIGSRAGDRVQRVRRGSSRPARRAWTATAIHGDEGSASSGCPEEDPVEEGRAGERGTPRNPTTTVATARTTSGTGHGCRATRAGGRGRGTRPERHEHHPRRCRRP